MTTKKIYLFEYISSEGALHIGEIGNTLLLWGLLSILLLTFLSFASSIQPRDQAEYLDSFLMAESLPSSTGNILRQPYHPSLPSVIFALILFHQYVRSHIAEKRPSDGGSKLTNLHFGVQTTLSYSVVFFLFTSSLAAATLAWAKRIVNLRRQMKLRGLFQLSMFQETFLIQGGL